MRESKPHPTGRLTRRFMLQEKMNEKLRQPPEGCTFTPQFYTRRPTTAKGTKQRYETLYENAKRIAAKREAKAKMADAEHPFKPQIRTSPAGGDRKGNVFDTLYKKVS